MAMKAVCAAVGILAVVQVESFQIQVQPNAPGQLAIGKTTTAVLGRAGVAGRGASASHQARLAPLYNSPSDDYKDQLGGAINQAKDAARDTADAAKDGGRELRKDAERAGKDIKSEAVALKESNGGSTNKLKVASYFALWYAFNIGYNIYNKRALNALPIPWIVATIQMGTGLLYFFPLWALGLRKAPRIRDGGLSPGAPLTQLALWHMVAHISAVVSLGAGAVSFTHIVKAAEPVFTAGFAKALLGQTFALPVYLSLLPVILGVSLASLKELSFSWLGFGAAMTSNTASALRGIVAKKQMGKPQGENLDASNLYSVLTVLAFIMLVPLSLIVEGSKMRPVWNAAIKGGATAGGLSLTVLLSGLFYYLYNEVAFLALDSVHPVTHAVGNTIKRVVIIVSAVIVFRTPMNKLSIIGSTIAVAGTLLYSLVKDAYDKKK